MIRRTPGAFTLLLICLAARFSAPLSAQVVGHLPTASPYEDLAGKHLLALQAGWVLPSRDPAKVGPKAGVMLIGRYEYDVSGPLWMTARGGLAPGLARNVRDPLLAGVQRELGERVEPLFFLDGGLALSLTGDKAWKRLAPRLHGNMGLVASLNSDYDIGGYRFGPKFVLSWGFSMRGVTGSAWEWNADITQAAWRMQYPVSYTGDGTLTDESILGDQQKNPWNSNLMITFGITRVLKR